MIINHSLKSYTQLKSEQVCGTVLAEGIRRSKKYYYYLKQQSFLNNDLLQWRGNFCLKAGANARNIVGQQDATLLGPTCCERLRTMLCVVATCCNLLDEV